MAYEMMGYGYTDEYRKRARMNGLLTAGLALLGARRGQELQALGRAGLLGVGAYNQDMRDTAEERRLNIGSRRQEQLMAMEQARMEEAQRLAQGMEAARVGAMTNIPSYGPPTAAGEMSPAVQQFDWNRYAQGVEGVDPMRALAIRQAIAPKAAEMPYDKPKPEHYTPQSLAAFARSRNPADLVPVTKPEASAVGKINPSDFTPQSVAAFMQGGMSDYSLLSPVDKTPRTTVNISNPLETEEQKALGKARAESFVTLSKAGGAARGKLQQLDAIDALIGNVETSPLTPIGMKAAGYGEAVGLTLDPKLPQKQAAETIVNKMALDARSTADGAGMPGAMSDADREFLIRSVPNLTQTMEGRRKVVTVYRRLAHRQQEYATLANRYRLERGTFDEGFEDYARKHFADKPLFADMGTATSSAAFDAEFAAMPSGTVFVGPDGKKRRKP